MSPAAIIIEALAGTRFTVEPWNGNDDFREDDEETYDPWIIADQAENLFREAGLRPMRNKDLGLLAFDHKMDAQGYDPVLCGCTYHRVYHADAEDFGGPEDETVMAYDFDLAVHPEYQGGTVGYMLAHASIKEAHANECRVIRLWVINPTMAKLLSHLGFEHESTPETREGYSTHMILWL